MFMTSDIVNNLNTAFQLISAGTNEKVRQSEQLLAQLRDNVHYPKVLFDYFQSYEVTLGLRAAIEFKLWFKEYRNFDEYKAQYVQEAVSAIKLNIVQAYMLMPTPIAHQIKEAIYSIAQRDFPNPWRALMTELNAHLLVPQHILKALKLIRKLTEKYVYSCRSDPLYEEIIFTCDTIHNNLLILAQSLLQQIQGQQNLDQTYKILKSLLRVFYHLSFQDLHPSFEDNLNNWMEFMKIVLRLADDLTNSSLIFKCKGEALKCVLLYATKYRDDFQGLIQEFSSEIWNVCTQTTEEKDGDRILSNALKYFKSLVAWSDMRQFFEQNLQTLMQSLIIKNMMISKSEALLFSQEPQQFIDIFFEYSDLDSRRAQAIDLFKVVTRTFPEAVNRELQTYISTYIQSGMQNPEAEVILINLLVDGGTVGFTSKDGTVDVQLAIEIIQGFYQTCLKPKFGQIYSLIESNQPIESKFTAIQLAFFCRYIFFYRNFLDKNEIPSMAQIIVYLIASKRATLAQIACYTVNALITVRAEYKNYANQTLYFSQVSISPVLQTILNQLYPYIRGQAQLESISLKLTNNVILLWKDLFIALDAIGDLISDLLKKAKEAYEFQNVHLVFETLASVVDSAVQQKNSQAANQLQQKLLNQLDEMLRENKGDVTNFILQIYALFIQVQTNATGYYQGISSSFLDVANWNEGNSSLFAAYITYFEYWFKFNEIPNNQLQMILANIVGHSVSAFTQLSELLIKANQQWVPIVIQIAFRQYEIVISTNVNIIQSKSKAINLNQKLINKEILLILSSVCNLYGPLVLIQECGKINPKLMEGFLVNELSIIQSISSRAERKQIFIMLTKILFQAQSLSQEAWNAIFKAVIDNIYMKKRNPLKFIGRVQEREVTSGSGFQALKPILAAQNLSKINQDEDKFFCQGFKEFYSNPIVQSNLKVAEIIDQHQQEMLSSMLQQV